ncbi:hypothetical protein EGR_09284 [Echinococcus granulosus]|uniref:Uncharacterized protein n=1 Tax=Echinococcus granulosus TaxID=6210 RepID=W6U5L7_ECHGR|nr:hypothetical protein EGR_09284 [Echinococcus granulosus]EUB55881.1 hypothetical protein EGR_09284 [Echinococcus granulosus]
MLGSESRVSAGRKTKSISKGLNSHRKATDDASRQVYGRPTEDKAKITLTKTPFDLHTAKGHVVGCPPLPSPPLPSVSSHQHPPPSSLDGLVFSISTRVAEGAEVCLRCEYFLRPQANHCFTMLISFVEEVSPTRTEVAVAASTRFRYPGNLREAHKKSGKVVNVSLNIGFVDPSPTVFNRPMV